MHEDADEVGEKNVRSETSERVSEPRLVRENAAIDDEEIFVV